MVNIPFRDIVDTPLRGHHSSGRFRGPGARRPATAALPLSTRVQHAARLTPPRRGRICRGGTRLPTEARLSERVDDMTDPAAPAARPANPNFSSGPCAKRPGWSLDALKGAAARPLAPRQDRQGEAQAGDRPHPRGARGARPTTASASCRPPTPAPSRWRCGRCSAPAAVDVLAWESFGHGWVTDVVKQLKLPDARTIKADYGKLPDLAQVDFNHDVVFTWNGTTSGVRVPERRLDPGRPRRASRSATRPRPPSPRTSTSTSSMSSPSPGRRRSAARRRTA